MIKQIKLITTSEGSSTEMFSVLNGSPAQNSGMVLNGFTPAKSYFAHQKTRKENVKATKSYKTRNLYQVFKTEQHNTGVKKNN